MADNYVEVRLDKNIARIILNREHHLNAISHDMLLTIRDNLIAFEQEPKIQAVFIQANGRAFCAGGDIRSIFALGKKQLTKAKSLFKDEYQLNYLISKYKKPYIAWLDGITMGGGAGLSIHSKYCIATENLKFAMPETGIGFFPDIGSSYFLSRLPGSIGLYLGLTGKIITVDDAIYCGLLKYNIPSKNIDKCQAKLISSDNISRDIEAILAECSISSVQSELEKNRELIDKCFSKQSVEEILAMLQQQQDPWCDKVVESINKKSPTSLKVTHKLFALAKDLELKDCLQLDYCLASNFLENQDFYTGIKSVIIDKSKVSLWQPNLLDEVSDNLVESYFLLDESDMINFF